MGRSYTGALGPHGADFIVTPTPLGTHVRSAAAGIGHTLFITDDGSLWGVGSNEFGQLGLGAGWASADTPERLATDVIAVAAGHYFTLFLTRDRTLWGLGWNGNGQLGDGTTILRYKPVLIAASVIAMAGGQNHTLFITTDGTLWACGANGSGQLGNGTATDSLRPVTVASGVSAVSAGASFSLFLKNDGSLWAMGDNIAGQLGDGTTTTRFTPVPTATGVATISAGAYFSAFIKTDATLWVCGDNPNGQLGTGNTVEVHTPVQLASSVSAVATGVYHTLFRKTDATVWATGSNYSFQQGDNAPLDQRETPAPVATGIATMFAGGSHSLFLRPDGTLLGVGKNNDHQLGGGSVARATPVRLADDVIAVSGGTQHTAFLKADGTLWTTGYNDYGQLGDGTTRDRPEPVLVAGNVAAVATGTYTTFFIKQDATLWATGENYRGQLGDGTTTDRSTPVQVATGVTAVRASNTITLFLKADRTLWGMGQNQFGEIDGSGTLNLSTPVLVATDVITMDAGQEVTVYITTDGVLHARGDLFGGFGHTNPNVARTPIDLMTHVADVTLGERHALVRGSDGTLWVMGLNNDGQLGLNASGVSFLGSWFPNIQPDPVQLATGVTAIAAGFRHSAFLRADGTLWTMGLNAEGQLGNGTTTSSGIPVLVASGVTQVAAGTVDTFFLQPTAPMVTTSPVGGQLGHSVTLSVAATGSVPLSYQWFLNGEPLANATSATLATSAPGSYRVLVGGTTWSEPAILTIPHRLRDFSARARVGTGDRLLIAGFVIAGPTATAKSLLLRGVGPTLAQFGVSPVLAQPSLALFDQHGNALPSAYLRHSMIFDGPVDGYDYYAFPFDVPGLVAQVGLFPLLPADANSTRPDLLPPGGYSLHVSSADGGEGLALAELYEVDDDPLPMVGFSARGWAGRGDDTLITGVVLAGSQSATLLLRGVGPTLASFGVAGALAAPELTLFDAHGQRVATNTGWGTAVNPADIVRAATATGAFPLQAGSADSALLVTLDPGIYTIHATPAANTAPGIALVEIYLVP
jgi:alpha-tubulin suppressor-like RCC1 family protein